jgi:hypothetical protein
LTATGAGAGVGLIAATPLKRKDPGRDGGRGPGPREGGICWGADIPLGQRPAYVSSTWSEDDYDVYAGQWSVGRIFKADARHPAETAWMWTILFHKRRPPGPHQGFMVRQLLGSAITEKLMIIHWFIADLAAPLPASTGLWVTPKVTLEALGSPRPLGAAHPWPGGKNSPVRHPEAPRGVCPWVPLPQGS